MAAQHHPDNRMAGDYPLQKLGNFVPELREYFLVKDKRLSLNFSNPNAVFYLNKALLHHHYGIDNWAIPEDHLVPAVPGRLDQLLTIRDVVYGNFNLSEDSQLRGLDIGAGASLIYCLLAINELPCVMTGSDISASAIEHGKIIITDNNLQDRITLVLQGDKRKIFEGVVKEDDHYDFVICNPPFYKSEDEANKAANRKVRNLKTKQKNFAGNKDELIYPGGEKKFISRMIKQSKSYARQILWFTCLVSAKRNLHSIENDFKNAGIKNYLIKAVGHGQKTSSMILWSYLSAQEITSWKKEKWQ